MLHLVLAVAKEAGLTEIYLSAKKDYVPLIKTIRKNGGVYERSFELNGEQAEVYKMVL